MERPLTAWTSNMFSQLVPSYVSISPYAAALKSPSTTSDDVPFGHQPGPAGIAVAQSQSSGKAAIDFVKDMAAESIGNDDCAVLRQGVTWTTRRTLYASHPSLQLSRPHAYTTLNLLTFNRCAREISSSLEDTHLPGIAIQCPIGRAQQACLAPLQRVS